MKSPTPLLKDNPAVRILSPKQEEKNERGDLFRVRIMDNDTNTYQQVIDICIEALAVTYDEALHIALAIDHNGYADVYESVLQDANRIAGIIRKIGIEVRVEPAAGND